MKDRVTLEHTGYRIEGYATINMWGGGQGIIEMTSTTFSKEHLSKDNVLGCINDGEFGCESVECAEIEIYRVYGRSYSEYDRSLHANSMQCRLAHRGITPKKAVNEEVGNNT